MHSGSFGDGEQHCSKKAAEKIEKTGKEFKVTLEDICDALDECVLEVTVQYCNKQSC